MFSRLLVMAILVLHLISIVPINAAAEGKPAIAADSVILIETGRGQVLYEKSSSKKLHVSISNKIMTAIIAIENAKLNDNVTISKEAEKLSNSIIKLEAGEKYTLEDLVHAIILTSANDAATSLAEFAGGDTSKFVGLMNKKAQELKLSSTVFTNPTGLYDKSQYTTANDLSILIKYAISNPTFNRIFSTSGIPWNDGQNSRIMVNSNKLFWSYDGVDGGKTGFNEENKHSAVTTATRNGMRLISVVLDSPGENILKDSAQLLDLGFNNFKRDVLVKSSQQLTTINVEGSDCRLICKEDVYYTHPVGEDFIKDLKIKTDQKVKLPISTENVIGVATYLLKDDTRIDVNLYSDAWIYPTEKNYSYFIDKITAYRDLFILIIILLLVELALIANNLKRFIQKKFFLKNQFKK